MVIRYRRIVWRLLLSIMLLILRLQAIISLQLNIGGLIIIKYQPPQAQVDLENMQPILQSQSQAQTCQVCKLQPLPQSTQYLPLIVLQFLLIIINYKISLIVLLLGYFFSRTLWVCPMCKRQIQVNQAKQQSTSQHIIIRLNDFMLLVSKLKYRIVAFILILIIGYSYFNQPNYQFTPRVKIQKTWKSIVSNCGYDVYIDNSFKAKYLYKLYEETSNWQLQAVYLSHNISKSNSAHAILMVKMIPTQFSDQDSEDIRVLCILPKQKLEKGDIIKFNGEWSGRKQYIMYFLAQQIVKTGRKINNFESQIQVLTHGSLREHSS